MAKQYDFMNLNPCPIMLPGQTGAMATFQPGEGTNNLWFSRFCSKGKLTDMRKAGAVRPIVAPRRNLQQYPGNVEMLQDTNLVIEDETRFYRKRSGIFECKLCNIFRTGSTASMDLHLQTIHGVSMAQAEETKTEPVATAVVVPTTEQLLAEKTQAEPESPSAPADEAPAAPAEAEAPAEVQDQPQGFPCPYCSDRVFKTESARKAHITRMHPEMKQE